VWLLVALPALSMDPTAFATAERLINSEELDDQRIPEIGSGPGGRSVIVWQSRNQDNPGWGVYGRLLNSDGEPVADEFRANDFDLGSHDGQQVRMAPDGSFVVAWNGADARSSRAVIQARRFGPDGLPLGPDQRISDAVDDIQILPRFGLAAGGALAVAWEGRGVTGPSFNIIARELDGQDRPLGPPRQVNTFDLGAQRNAELVMNADGQQVAAWQSVGEDGNDWGIVAACGQFGQGFGLPILVNQTTTGGQARPRAAIADDGRFVIVWHDNIGQSTFTYRRVMARIFSPDCSPLSDEIQVNQFDERIQDLPHVAIAGDGRVLVVWQSFTPEFEDQGIYGRGLRLDGSFLGDEFLISSEREAFQDFPAVAGLPDGGFVVTWESAGQDESGYGIFARRFFGPAPAMIEVQSGDNQTARVNTAFAEPIRLRVIDQWGEPRIGQPVRLKVPSTGPSARFENGATVIELLTDDVGQIEASLTAGALPGAFSISANVIETGISVRFGLTNEAPPRPVPALGRLGALILLFAVVLIATRVLPRN